ncbi:MAG: peroxiredoxin [Myxococcota bacterium]|jgi:peroxiredoxin
MSCSPLSYSPVSNSRVSNSPLATSVLLCLVALLTFGCEKDAPKSADKGKEGDKAPAAKPAPAPEKVAANAKAGAEVKAAVPPTPTVAVEKKTAPVAETSAPTALAVGTVAPEFTTTDVDGKSVKLSDFKGKIVVLEWFTPDCPFVRIAHGENGGLATAAKDYAAKGVVWLAINSGGAGRQGHGKAVNIAGRTRFGLTHAILLDEDGEIGKRYFAKRTPQMFVIDANGVIAYRGALDNTGGGDPDDKTTHYLANALDAVVAGKPVPEPRATKAWGCSVKYAGK